MKCKKCNSERILQAGGKCSDMFSAVIGNNEYSGYVPSDLGIGGGDYVEINVCLDCGQLQGKFPRPQTEMEKDSTDEELLDFFQDNFNVGEAFQNIYASRQARMIKEAQSISHRLGRYINQLLDGNCDMDSKDVVPEFAQFLKMYRSNTFEVDRD
jgi:hypothetical protein